jgi:predicted ATP-grasp superfamily ATP-dependent carboligase
MKALIPAMEKRSSLAIVRSLGKKGVEIIGCSDRKDNSGFFSKYCHKKYIYCSPFLDLNRYLRDIKKVIEKERPDIFFPVNEETLIPLLKERDFFEKRTNLPLPSNQMIDKTLDKVESLKLARKLKIPCPRLIDKNSKDISYPIIVRPRFSREVKGNRVIARRLSYALSQKDLIPFLGSDFFFQEYVPGRGYGFYALFKKGVPKAYFMLKRIHEVPFTGGPSSLRESVYEEKLKDYGLKILKELKWHGVAMVEFRRDDRDGQFKFIEINPRFWGSLALSIFSGIDFPDLLLKMSQRKRIGKNFDYKTGIKCRWLFGDFSFLWSILFSKEVDFRPSRLKTVLEFFKFFEKDLHYDYFQEDDLKPALFEILFSFKKLFKKIL